MKTIKTENDVKTLVKKWFDERGAWSYSPVQNGLGVHGIPDRVGVIPVTVTPEMVGKQIGLFIAIECKSPGRCGEPNRGMSKHQALVGEEINGAAGRFIVCDGEDDLQALDRGLVYLVCGGLA